MALFVNQDDQRTELQKKLVEELQEKAKKRSDILTDHDGVEDSRYVEDTKTTTSLAWVWILITIAVVAVVIRLIIISMAK